MNAQERALADKGGRSFADLCDDLRAARRTEIRAVAHLDRCKIALRDAQDAAALAHDAVDAARDALDALIDRECAE